MQLSQAALIHNMGTYAQFRNMVGRSIAKPGYVVAVCTGVAWFFLKSGGSNHAHLLPEFLSIHIVLHV
jgi:hypothetical protein